MRDLRIKPRSDSDHRRVGLENEFTKFLQKRVKKKTFAFKSLTVFPHGHIFLAGLFSYFLKRHHQRS